MKTHYLDRIVGSNELDRLCLQHGDGKFYHVDGPHTWDEVDEDGDIFKLEREFDSKRVYRNGKGKYFSLDMFGQSTPLEPIKIYAGYVAMVWMNKDGGKLSFSLPVYKKWDGKKWIKLDSKKQSKIEHNQFEEVEKRRRNRVKVKCPECGFKPTDESDIRRSQDVGAEVDGSFTRHFRCISCETRWEKKDFPK